MDDEELLHAECKKLVGSRFGTKWTIDALIGVGGMAAVYSATHKNGRTAAIKVLHRQYAELPRVRERFLREAYIANKIDHPGVVRVEDDDTTPDGLPFLVMELLLGESLAELQERRGGKLPTLEVMRIVERVLDVMEEAHAAGIVHRDLKPENLFLTRDAKVKVLDFGIARLLEGTEPSSRTRTGLVMGTPAFMAPEQALGRWSQVDARTDLWAIGAVAFTLITDRIVHEAPSGNETLVLAAAKPAPSLARFSDAPLSVVRCVDRALAYDQKQRFDDAASMHGEVLFVLSELTRASAAPRAPSVRPGSRPPGSSGLAPLAMPPAPSVPSSPPGPEPRRPSAAPRRPPERERGGLDVLDAGFPGTGDAMALADAFRQLEHSLFTRQQYGVSHPELARSLDRALAAFEKALAASDGALVWQITPYAFTLADELVWEPRAPFDRIPYRLFADGLRLLGIVAGVEQRELAELVRIISRDKQFEVSPDDDFVTLLWEAGFAHVVYRAIDTFTDGMLESREAFDVASSAVTALVEFDTSFQLEDCWQDAKNGPRRETLLERSKRLAQMLALGATNDREALVRAEAFQLRDIGPDLGSVIDVDPVALEVFRARFADEQVVEARFVRVLAEAFRAAVGLGLESAVTVPLRAALDDLAASSPARAARFARELFEAFEDREHPGQARQLRNALAKAAVSERAFRALLGSASGADADAAHVELTREVLRVSNAFVPSVIELLLSGAPRALWDALTEYLSQNAEGHEQTLAQAFVKVDLDIGLQLVRVLGRLGTPAAREAALRAVESPHALVRIEALAHVDSASERLRLELRTLIEDSAPEVRMTALTVIRERLIRAAGPQLTLRVKAAGFDKLPLEERRQVLLTLAALAPARAETLCVELLGDSRLLTIPAHEESRALAAEVLGQIASTPEALAALETAAGGRFRYSERVRNSAGLARSAAEVRLSQRPPPAESMQVGRGVSSIPPDAKKPGRGS